MIKLTQYPYTYKLAGETWELHESMIRRILTTGQENKLSLDGKIIGVDFSEELNDMAVGVLYPKQSHVYFITKQNGWLGPFDYSEELEFDLHKKEPVIKQKEKPKVAIEY